MKINMVSWINQPVDSVELNDAIFSLPVRKDILQRAVEWQRAKKQAGTRSTKGISEIAGSTAKPWKQKGTGNARQGSKRATQWRGGATVFGPVVRSHAYDLTKKFRKLALRTALSSKFLSNNLIIIDNFDGQEKTKEVAQKIYHFGWKKPLIVDVSSDKGIHSAAKNIKHVDVLPVVGLNVLDILKHQELILTKAALDALQERLS